MFGRRARGRRAGLAWAWLLLGVAAPVAGADLETIGVTDLRALVPSLNGTNVPVAQPEAVNPAPSWQVNPAAVSQPPSLFGWFASNGFSTNFPNALGQESGHADQVAGLFYGAATGVAPGLSHVDNYEASYFFALIQTQAPLTARVVNQSFVFTGQETSVDADYDNHAARFNTLFVSGAGNTGSVRSPGTAYNGLAVGAYGGTSSIGPTSDGRCKPDVAAPASFTSFSAPLVSGVASLLIQAGLRSDGGPFTATAATDSRTVKALLLNGAVKPADWTNGVTSPLDARYGAGIVHALNSYHQLRGGQYAPILTTTALSGSPHLPPANTNEIPVRRGWNLRALSNARNQDVVDHYFFTLPSAPLGAFTLQATLVWQRQRNQSAINNLDLFLFSASTSALVASSQSPVDNVEHLLAIGLPPGRYDLQVLKNGTPGQRLTASETYALAFEFGPPETPQLAHPACVAGQFSARLSGEPLQDYLIRSSTDLVNWAPVVTNTTSIQGTFDWTDPVSGPPDQRFYRAIRLP
jgi:hypothetical protein